MPDFTVRPITEDDREWIAHFTEEHWGSDWMVSRGARFRISEQAGFAAETDDIAGDAGDPAGRIVGLLTYHIEKDECEVTSLDSLREGMGIGSALIEAVKKAASRAGVRRLFLITTNDNVDALRFYQRRGFVLAALRRDAVTEARLTLKPEIPLTGSYGIPIRDELELELILR